MIPSGAVVLVAPTVRVLGALSDEPLGAAATGRRERLRRPADRADFTAARLLAVAALRALTGEEVAVAAIVQRCDDCGGPHGRPLPTSDGIHLSWAHAGGVVAAAAGRSRLGVDIEPLAVGPDRSWEDVSGVALSAEERAIVAAAPEPALALLRAWTAKEALTKAGAARLDAFPALRVLADDASVRPRVAGLDVGSRTLGGREGDPSDTAPADGLVVATATAGPVRWLSLDADGGTLPLPARPVGSAA